MPTSKAEGRFVTSHPHESVKLLLITVVAARNLCSGLLEVW